MARGRCLLKDDPRGRPIHAWFAIAQTERVVAGRRMIEVARVRITEDGRRAIDE
jgi:hypothetical protein